MTLGNVICDYFSVVAEFNAAHNFCVGVNAGFVAGGAEAVCLDQQDAEFIGASYTLLHLERRQ